MRATISNLGEAHSGREIVALNKGDLVGPVKKKVGLNGSGRETVVQRANATEGLD